MRRWLRPRSNAEPFVARELAPARLRSGRKINALGVTDTRRLQVLGPLRDPAGASSLATTLSVLLSPELKTFRISNAPI